MSQTLEKPPVFVRVATENRTIITVVDLINRQLYRTEIEPEWLNPANWHDDAKEAFYGPLASRPWPTVGARERLAVSVSRGWSEGWLIYVDYICHVGEAPNLATGAQKLMIGKTLSSSQAWEVAKALTTMLDIA